MKTDDNGLIKFMCWPTLKIFTFIFIKENWCVHFQNGPCYSIDFNKVDKIFIMIIYNDVIDDKVDDNWTNGY